MPLNPQTANFPPISQVEHSWEQNLRAFAKYLVPGAGARSGLDLGLPASGLTPTLTDGYMIQGDQVLGPYGSKLISAPPAEVTNKNLFFGLSGLYWGDANNAPLKTPDVLVGVVTTDVDSVIHVAQMKNYGGGRIGVRGVVNLEKATKGADVTAFDLAIPNGFDYARIIYAQARVAAATTAGVASGEDFNLKIKIDDAAAVKLVTIDDLSLGDVGTLATFAIADSDDEVVAYQPTSIKTQYSQADTSSAIEGGVVEFYVELMLY